MAHMPKHIKFKWLREVRSTYILRKCSSTSEKIKKNFLINFKIRVGLQEEMLLARSKEEGDEKLGNKRQIHKSPRVVPRPVMTRHFPMYL